MEAEKLDHNLNNGQRIVTTTSSNTTSHNPITTTTSAQNTIESQANQSLDEFSTTIDEKHRHIGQQVDRDVLVRHNVFNQNCLNQTVFAHQLISGTNIYQMLSKPRGFCIIINNVDFDDNRFPRRVGSDEECIRLSNIFAQLYFEVHIKRNQSRQELLQTLRTTAKHNDLKKHDCLVVIILSHGNSGQIILADNSGLPFEQVLTIFNNQNCHQLIRKPKMFFFNCCRGSTLDFGPQFTNMEDMAGQTAQDEESDDVADATPWPHVPIISDMLICYSTIDGYVSWRNEVNGTWFGSALALALEHNACVAELNQILTIASDIVHNRTTKNGAKQAIEWKYRAWTKSLYFNPGYSTE